MERAGPGRQAVAVVLVFVAGLVFGRVFEGRIDPRIVGLLIRYVLLVLVLLVGLEMGVNAERLEHFRRLALTSLLVALSTIIGSIMGGVAAHYLTGVPLGVAAAVGAGMGWYTFTGPYLAMMDPYYGLLGFTVNLLREILTLVIYPLSSRRLRFASISLGGATTMDSTLPIIARFGGMDAGIVAFIHGFLLTLSVPVLVPLLAEHL